MTKGILGWAGGAIIGAILGAIAWCVGVVILNGAVFAHSIDRGDIILFLYLGPVLGAILGSIVWLVVGITDKHDSFPVYGAIVGVIVGPIVGIILVIIVMQQLVTQRLISEASYSEGATGYLALHVLSYTVLVGPLIGATIGIVRRFSKRRET